MKGVLAFQLLMRYFTRAGIPIKLFIIRWQCLEGHSLWKCLEGALTVMMVFCCRFFSRGAVDAYNSRTVLIQSTNFSHNQLNNLAKEDAYRGHSAGLSIG